jgi:hypothetical protein
MSEQDEDKAFLERSKKLFDESAQQLDGKTRSQLNRGRQNALAELQPRTGVRAWTGWAPATGVAAAAVVAAVMWNGNAPPNDTAPTSSATDFEILLNEDNLEMLEELEFYSWLELDEEAGGNVG